MIKEFLIKRRNAIQAKKLMLRQAMNSEIVNAIQFQVMEEQKKSDVSIPYFLEVDRRYEELNIKTADDLRRVYKNFLKLGWVSGAINV